MSHRSANRRSSSAAPPRGRRVSGLCPLGGRKQQLLVVDDDTLFLGGLVRLLQSWGYHVTETSDPSAAAAMCTTLTFDLLITDLEMPGLDGAALVAAVQRGLGDTCPPILVLTGMPHPPPVPGAAAVIAKTADLSELVDTIADLVE